MYIRNPANLIIFFSLILKLDMNPGYFSLNINPIPIGGTLIKDFPVYMFYIIWERQCAKIIVAQVVVAYSVVIKSIFVPLNQYG